MTTTSVSKIYVTIPPMKYMQSAVLSSLLALSFAGCGNKLESAVEDWKSAACACKDKACAEKQEEAFNKIEHDFKEEIKKVSKESMQKIDNLLDKANECLGKYDVRAG